MKTKYFESYKIIVTGNDEDNFSYHVVGEGSKGFLNFQDHDFECPEFAFMAAEDMIKGL